MILLPQLPWRSRSFYAGGYGKAMCQSSKKLDTLCNSLLVSAYQVAGADFVDENRVNETNSD
jgi:hypothetical protein